MKSTSPLTLTDYGIEISEKIHAKEIANRYAGKLTAEVKGLNAYQIQEYCFDYCKEKILDDLKMNDQNKYETIHTVAFENGVDIERITRVIAIML